MATTTNQAWRQRVRPFADVPAELAVDGFDDRLLLGGPEAEAALQERLAQLEAYRERTGAARTPQPPAD